MAGSRLQTIINAYSVWSFISPDPLLRLSLDSRVWSDEFAPERAMSETLPKNNSLVIRHSRSSLHAHHLLLADPDNLHQ
jgi:hypothetical protein